MYIDNVLITEERVRVHLQKLKSDKSPGPDGIPSRLLKELADFISWPLATIFMKSLECGSLPQAWKMAHVSPIYKGGSRLEANSFRPASLTCTCGKILESLIKQDILVFLSANHVFNTNQHEFRPGKSWLIRVKQVFEGSGSWTHKPY